MRQSRPAALDAVLLLILLLHPPLAAASGIITIQLEMGQTIHQRYECVFVGVVTANGKACPGAHVEADMAGVRGEAVTQMADADAGGRYTLHLTLEGSPTNETLWTLRARAAIMGAVPSEIEGRVILSEEPTVMIDRSIQLDGNGV